MKDRKLGWRQEGVLESLVQFDGWNNWSGRWVWDTPGNTAKICESLVRKGLAERISSKKLNGFYTYKATNKGRDYIKDQKSEQ